MSYQPFIGLRSEYQKEYLDYSGKRFSSKEWRRFAAGVPTQPPPDCRPEEYTTNDGFLPAFRGKSISKSDYVPQPHITRTQNKSDIPIFKVESATESTEKESATKSPTTKNQNESTKGQLDCPPMLLLPGLQEKESESKASFRPFPLHLARSQGTTVPAWRQRLHDQKNQEPRCDLTSSYQADYCGMMTKPRRICLDTRAGGGTCDNSFVFNSPTMEAQTKQPLDHQSLHVLLNDYVESLLFRTTTGTTFRPPSAFGGPPCNPDTKLRCPRQKIFRRESVPFTAIDRFEDVHPCIVEMVAEKFLLRHIS